MSQISTVPPFYLDLTEDEIAGLQSKLGEILRSGQLMLGPNTDSFEEEFAHRMCVRHAVSTNSGTSALEILLRVQGVEGKRVAVATNTNFASAAAIIHAGGEPVWLDMSADTFMPTVDMLEEAHKSSGISGFLAVHIGGLIPPDFEDQVQYCKDHNLFLLEDSAHAHGSMLAGKCAGSFAEGGAFSFFPTKVMTTMEGGMITTNDQRTADLARSYRNQGKGGSKFGSHHTELGNSWRINELSAAIGRVQLAKLDDMITRRNRAATRFAATLNRIGVPYCRFEHMDQASQYKLIVRIPQDKTIDDLKARFREQGVILGGGVYEQPCHLQPVFSHVQIPSSGLSVSEQFCSHHICPPLTSGLDEDQIAQVEHALESCLTP
ncbi:MAG: DegT/DnrJ/EryC1/StrS family aminotransferase [Phycisphaerales bacterium]